jgi:uncharacterized protein
VAGLIRVGLVSDTHGLLRPEAIAFLRGSDHIVHAGDIGKPEILAQLQEIAAVTAVRGNNDTGDWADAIPEHASLQLGGVRILVLHDVAELRALAQDAHVVVTGHSHKPLVQQRGSVLFVNPGSAGPRRFKLPVCAGELLIEGGKARARLVDLLAQQG